MTLTFISNYINHHQIPFSDCLYAALGDGYHFVQTEPMDEERKEMGWQTDLHALPYLICAYEQPELVNRLLLESDVVIFGGCEDQEMIQPRLLLKKLTFRYSERIYREGQWKFVSPRGLKQKYHDHIRFRKTPVYLLCAGGYVASDFRLIHAYPDKMFRWGYFPVLKTYPDDDCHEKRKQNAVPVILWAGRFITLKHPEAALWLIKELKEADYACHLRMIGGGPLEADLKQQVERMGIADSVEFCGFQKPDQVRASMEEADIHLFTSDYKEGWGAVLNEAMNSGCAVVANQAIGAVPYLIQDGINGYVYPNGDLEMMKKRVCALLKDRSLRLQMGQSAYETIRNEWNPQTAAERLLGVCRQLLSDSGQKGRAFVSSDLQLPKQGPMSRAPIQSPGFWH